MPSIGFLEADERRVYALSALRPQTLELVALDARDGTPLWRYEQSGLNPRRAATRPVPLPNGTVCWTTDTTVHMIDATSGEARWTRTLDDQCRLSGAAIRDDSVFLACRKSLHALSSATGEPLWQATLEVESFGERRPMIALDDRRIFVALPKGSRATLLCLDRDERTLLWQHEVARVHHLLAEDGTLYVRADKIIALNAASGEAAWTYAAQGCGPITRSGGLLHLADAREGGRLVALDKSTGEAEWYLAGLRSCNGFVRSGGTGYIKTLDGVVHAFALRHPARR
jgi:outer membrane protein assembly factor BamB